MELIFCLIFSRISVFGENTFNFYANTLLYFKYALASSLYFWGILFKINLYELLKRAIQTTANTRSFSLIKYNISISIITRARIFMH
ncbi:unnamed protein product [Meloidogyne enterolobii]|uniref:Uncharacterized protein n=1 Tax=Meloidogyne enterolobii TaxID=390850 RepID=A0ACB0ZGH7_MELEN